MSNEEITGEIFLPRHFNPHGFCNNVTDKHQRRTNNLGIMNKPRSLKDQCRLMMQNIIGNKRKKLIMFLTTNFIKEIFIVWG